MQELYRECWAWNEETKKRELRRYWLVIDWELLDKLGAMAHFNKSGKSTGFGGALKAYTSPPPRKKR